MGENLTLQNYLSPSYNPLSEKGVSLNFRL